MGRCLPGWLLSRLGDSIHRGKHLTGLLGARRAICCQWQAANDGCTRRGTNGHSEIVSPLEP